MKFLQTTLLAALFCSALALNAAARNCFDRSLRLYSDNPTAQNYQIICQQKLIEKSSGKPVLPPLF